MKKLRELQLPIAYGIAFDKRKGRLRRILDWIAAHFWGRA